MFYCKQYALMHHTLQFLLQWKQDVFADLWALQRSAKCYVFFKVGNKSNQIITRGIYNKHRQTDVSPSQRVNTGTVETSSTPKNLLWPKGGSWLISLFRDYLVIYRAYLKGFCSNNATFVLFYKRLTALWCFQFNVRSTNRVFIFFRETAVNIWPAAATVNIFLIKIPWKLLTTCCTGFLQRHDLASQLWQK